VLAYCEELLSGPAVRAAAADAFAGFRREVVSANRLDAVNPEALLLRSTRRAALERATPGAGGRSLRDVVRRRRATCDLVPDLLAAHAEELLSSADEERLARHLSACSECHELAERFMRAEHAYRDPPDRPLPRDLVNTIVAALAAASVSDAASRTSRPDGAVSANGEVAQRTARASSPANGGRTAPRAREAARPRLTRDDSPTLIVPALEHSGAERHRAPAIANRLLSGEFAVRVLIPALVVGAGVIVTLAIAGVFSSSDQGGGPARTPSTLPAQIAPPTLVAASHAPASSVPDELARAAKLAQDKRRQQEAAARAAKAAKAKAAADETAATDATTPPPVGTTPETSSTQSGTSTQQQRYSAQKVRKRTTKRPPSSPSGPSPGGTQTGPGGTPGL
jgi:hypothetical protein